MSSFVAALRAEVFRLEAELANNLIYQRLMEARRMLALYEADEPSMSMRQLGDIISQQFVAPRVATRTYTRAQSPERAKAMEAARLFLANRADPTPTSVIYDHIVSLGYPIGGTDPRNNLSAMLSNSPEFKSNGRAGWTLAEPEAAHPDGEPKSELAKLFGNDPPKANNE